MKRVWGSIPRLEGSRVRRGARSLRAPLASAVVTGMQAALWAALWALLQTPALRVPTLTSGTTRGPWISVNDKACPRSPHIQGEWWEVVLATAPTARWRKGGACGRMSVEAKARALRDRYWGWVCRAEWGWVLGWGWSLPLSSDFAVDRDTLCVMHSPGMSQFLQPLPRGALLGLVVRVCAEGHQCWFMICLCHLLVSQAPAVFLLGGAKVICE